jgi:2-polyprenyl-6-methoxyphenol hydroxylase-like FAD-dependent oxidoreductase
MASTPTATRTPRHVVVIGAGVAGLGAALTLSRRGHRVTLLERDATPLPADPDEAFAWDRRGAPQVRHSHALLARLHNLLRDAYPDVLAALLDAGATEMRFCDMLPAEMADREPRPGDDDLVALACRRTTFEWVLRRIVAGSELVTLRDGTSVDGLVADAGEAEGGQRPHVRGVRLDTGEVIEADLVVAATGRRTGGPSWLAELGVTPETITEDTGIVYLSRFYRLLDGVIPPVQQGPIGGDLGYLKYAIFQGDNRTHSVTMAVRTGDDDLRQRLLQPATFDLAARTLPATRAWVEPDTAEAITPVNVMAGLLNRRIRHTDDAGTPLVTGYVAIGDAHTCTNPLYGRGCSLAMVQAELLATALDDAADDAEVVQRYEDASDREILPWYRAAVAQDQMARDDAALRRGETSPDTGGADAVPEAAADATADATVDPKDFMREVMREGLLPALRTDPVVFRAFLRGFNLLEAPDALMADTDVTARVFAVYANRDNRPPEPDLGPPRTQMLAALTPA